MRTLTIVVAAAALSLAACKKKEKEAPAPTPTPTPVAAVDGGSAAVVPPTPVDPAMANQAGNCPVAVMGAVGTVIDDKAVPTAVVLTIVAKEAAATDTIRRRTSHLVEVQGAPDAVIKHSGEGTGGGEGPCPVVTSKEVKIASEEIEGGVKVTMTPSGGLTQADLAKDVAARLAKMATLRDFKPTDNSGGGAGVGGGSGDHGGNHSGDADGKGKQEKAAPPGEPPIKTGSGAGSSM
jgi:hypothetical protein